MTEDSIEMGNLVCCKVTGYVGEVIAICKYSHQESTYLVQPRKLKDGDMIESSWFTYKRIKVIIDEALPF